MPERTDLPLVQDCCDDPDCPSELCGCDRLNRSRMPWTEPPKGEAMSQKHVASRTGVARLDRRHVDGRPVLTSSRTSVSPD
jgi:hypothetical protein